MSHIGRAVKNVEAPRPLKSQSRSQLKNNYMLIEELILLLENVAHNLASGVSNTEPMATLVQNLRIHGPQLESVSKDTLDRAFVVFRNASQDERLNIMTRLNLLELIELRAKGWEDNGFNSYYKSKVTNVDLPDGHINAQMQHHINSLPTTYLSTSPTFVAGAIAATAAGTTDSLHQLQQQLLAPGEIIQNSGKFPKPTKIPGKTYSKYEVVIRNADSGKVMGIKGRRVHMIEELSETIISFQRVNPGAKERLVQITGPAEENINHAKELMEDTIRRNASPVRLEQQPQSGGATAGGGSCSSLASSASDETQPRAAGAPHGQGKFLRPANQQQMLLHSYSTNDASLGEYKYTVNVGQHIIKITGDCCDLVRAAKLVLDDYFSSNEFLASVEAGAALDASMISPLSTPSTPMGAPKFTMGTSIQVASPLVDNGIGFNYMSGQIVNNSGEGDDDVFVNANGVVTTSSSLSMNQSNSINSGLARSRRSHFSRKDSIPETTSANGRKNSEAISSGNNNQTRFVHEYEHLLFYAKSPHSWALPADWQRICKKFPAIVRNKVMHTISTNNSSQAQVPQPQVPVTIADPNNNNKHVTTIANAPSNNDSNVTMSNANGSSNVMLEDTNPFRINVKRKGLNRTTNSTDQETGFFNNREDNLLKKQIKMIEAITESGGGVVTGGGNKNPFKNSFDIDEIDENSEKLTNAVSSFLKTNSSMEFLFRSDSRCAVNY